MDKERILDNLDIGNFYQKLIPSLKVNGKPDALGLCPFHDDTHPSLSVNIEKGFFNCFSCNAKGDVFEFYKRFKDVDFPTALKELGEMAGIVEANIKPKVVASFEYKDEDGKLLYVKERLEPARNGRSKEFVFKHLAGDKWTLGRSGNPVLYNLPKFTKARYAFIVEGEAKSDLLAGWGLAATCLDSGASSNWRDEYSKALDGKEKVVILPDNDKAGRDYASKIAKALHNKVKEIKIVELSGLQEKGDIIDWAGIAGNDRAKLLEIVKAAPVWTPKKDEVREVREGSITLTRLSDLLLEAEENTSWLVDGILPSGGFSVVVAKPKVGKLTFARTLALHVASGEPFLERSVTKGTVVYLALEEKRSEVRRHFKDMGSSGSEEIHIYTGGTPADAIKQLKEVTQQLKPSLVIVDPLFRLTRVRDVNDYAQITNALDPLLRLARDSGTHVLCVHHANKMDGQDGNSVLGSQAIFGSVDSLVMMKRHENYRTIKTTQRYGEDIEETILNFDKTTKLITLGVAVRKKILP